MIDHMSAYAAMCVVVALTIIILALAADGWDGWL